MAKQNKEPRPQDTSKGRLMADQARSVVPDGEWIRKGRDVVPQNQNPLTQNPFVSLSKPSMEVSKPPANKNDDSTSKS